MSGPDHRWTAGPREMLQDMRVGTRFLSYDGDEWRIERKERNCVYVIGKANERTFFAARAEGVPITPGPSGT
jgi:hypothetical protein